MGRVKRLIVGVCGASGVNVSLKLLEALSKSDVEIHTIYTSNAVKVAEYELGMKKEEFLEELERVSVRVYDESQIEAPPASGTFGHDGMVILPCSMKTLACISSGVEINLLIRAASVTLKERKKLVICWREAPVRRAHLSHMLSLVEEGAIIMPLVMSFYGGDRSGNAGVDVEVMIKNIVGKIVDQFDIEYEYERWYDEN